MSSRSLEMSASRNLQKRAHALIPGGCHTYAKGDDQYPLIAPPFIARGSGCHVWDIDGNEYIEYGMGNRAVGLGHAYRAGRRGRRAPNCAAAATSRGPRRSRSSAPRRSSSLIDGAEMVKFCKDGSDATSAAVKLARAYTGRDMVAICADHPFFSTDDWFIGTHADERRRPRADQGS